MLLEHLLRTSEGMLLIGVVQPSLRSWELRTQDDDERSAWVRIFHEQGAELDATAEALLGIGED